MEPQVQQEIHGHLSKLVILIFILLILGAIGTWLGFRFTGKSDTAYTIEEKTVPITEQNIVKPLIIKTTDSPTIKKSLMLNRTKSASTVPLTTTERNMILKELGPKSISQYKLSDSEKKVILEALNRQ